MHADLSAGGEEEEEEAGFLVYPWRLLRARAGVNVPTALLSSLAVGVSSVCRRQAQGPTEQPGLAETRDLCKEDVCNSGRVM